jgi:transposase
MQTRSFVGMDVHKATISISIAEDGRNGPVRFLGVIPNVPEDIAKMAKRLSRHGDLDFCYEAGGCGYGIYRQLTALGHRCMVVATSMIPRKPGERIKTDRRDSQKLAILHRSGDLTPVWVPDATHEALRDLVRARVDATMHLMRARQQLLAFLLRHGRSYAAGKNWTQRHRSWLAGQTFELPVHRIVFQDYVEAVWTAQERRDTLIDRIEEMVASWSLGPLVEALRGLRGIDMISAATFIATTGDLSRFDSPRLLMGYLGRTLQRRQHPPRWDYQDRQQRSQTHADRGGMELPLSGTCCQGKSRDPRAPAEDHSRYRVESANASLCPL